METLPLDIIEKIAKIVYVMKKQDVMTDLKSYFTEKNIILELSFYIYIINKSKIYPEHIKEIVSCISKELDINEIIQRYYKKIDKILFKGLSEKKKLNILWGLMLPDERIKIIKINYKIYF